jgi:SAM-dependent methyltransferase
MSYSARVLHYAAEYIDTRDLEFLSKLISHGHSRVLEVPCGAGRVSVNLGQAAKHLIVVDIEPGMVASVLNRLRDAGLSAKTTGVCADMRTLQLAEDVDLAVVPREALQLLTPDDGKAALAAIGGHVAPGGAMMIDVATFAPSDRCLGDPDYYDPNRSAGTWHVDWTRRTADGSMLTRHSAQYDDERSILIEFRYLCVGPDNSRDEWSATMRLYRYDLDWFHKSVPQGFSIETVQGDYDGSPHGPDSSRLIVLFRRDLTLAAEDIG